MQRYQQPPDAWSASPVAPIDAAASQAVIRFGGGTAVLAAAGKAFTAGHCLSGCQVGDTICGLRVVRLWRRWDLALLESAEASVLKLSRVGALRRDAPVCLFGWVGGQLVEQYAAITRLGADVARASGARDMCGGDSGSAVVQNGRLVGIVTATVGPSRQGNRRCASTVVFARLEAAAVRRAIETAWAHWMR